MLAMRRRKTERKLLQILVLGLILLGCSSLMSAAEQQAAVPVDEAYVPPNQNPVIIPAPQEVTWLDGDFQIYEGSTYIVVGDDAKGKDLYAVRELNEELERRFGFKLPVMKASEVAYPIDAIVLGEVDLNSWSAELAAEEGIDISADSPGKEGYVLKVTPDYVLVAGSDQKGTFYGVQTLKQMIVPVGSGGVGFKGASIRDWPDFAFRGVHLIPDYAARDYFTKLIELVFSKYKYNHMIFESEFVKWDSVPELHQPWGASKEDVRKIIEVAEEHFIDVNPLIQSLGHVKWMFARGQNSDLKADPESTWAYNPLKERVYTDVLFPVMEEAIELFDADYVHIGHDEVDHRGRFLHREDMVKVGFKKLFTMDTLKIYEFLKERGVGTMMWADMFLEKEFTTEELEPFPRDIVMVHWDYYPRAKYPGIDYFQDAGFEVIGGTWFNPQNIRDFCREGHYGNIRGMLQTTWTGYYGNATAFKREFRQVKAYVQAGDYFWTALKPDPQNALPYDPGQRLLADWNGKTSLLKSMSGYTINLRPYANRSFRDEKDNPGWIGMGSGLDMRRVPTGRQRFKGVLFDIIDPLENGNRSAIMLRSDAEAARHLPEKVTGIEVGVKASRLVFLHTAGWDAGRGAEIGKYVVHYEDGTTETIVLKNEENIAYFMSNKAQLAWEGRTGMGVDVSLTMLDWVNPHPDKVITEFDFIANRTKASPVLVAVTAIMEE